MEWEEMYQKWCDRLDMVQEGVLVKKRLERLIVLVNEAHDRLLDRDVSYAEVVIHDTYRLIQSWKKQENSG